MTCDGPCGPCGWKREAGSGYDLRPVETKAIERAAGVDGQWLGKIAALLRGRARCLPASRFFQHHADGAPRRRPDAEVNLPVG